MATIVTAEVILRSPDGRSILEAAEGVTVASIEKYRPGKKTIDEACEKLTTLGFEVVQIGVVSITISGERTTFERVFRTKLDRPVRGAPGDQRAIYQNRYSIRIPEELQSQVAAVSFPIPPEFHP